MKYLVKIAPNSIRLNSECGQDHFMVAGNSRTEMITLTYLTAFRDIKGPHWRISTWYKTGGRLWLSKREIKSAKGYSPYHPGERLPSRDEEEIEILFNNHLTYLREMIEAQKRAFQTPDKPIIVIVNTTCGYQDVFTMGGRGSKYSWHYGTVKVQCNHCKRIFKNSKLGRDWIAGEDDDICIDGICPFCKEPDCCDIEFEKFTDEMGRAWEEKAKQINAKNIA